MSKSLFSLTLEGIRQFVHAHFKLFLIIGAVLAFFNEFLDEILRISLGKNFPIIRDFMPLVLYYLSLAFFSDWILKILRYDTVSIENSFREILSGIIGKIEVSLITLFLITLGFGFFVLPGCFFTIRWFFAVQARSDKKCRSFEALKESSKLTRNHMMSIGGLIILGIILKNIAYFIVGFLNGGVLITVIPLPFLKFLVSTPFLSITVLLPVIAYYICVQQLERKSSQQKIEINPEETLEVKEFSPFTIRSYEKQKCGIYSKTNIKNFDTVDIMEYEKKSSQKYSSNLNSSDTQNRIKELNNERNKALKEGNTNLFFLLIVIAFCVMLYLLLRGG